MGEVQEGNVQVIIWLLLLASFALGICLGAIYAGSVEVHERGSTIEQLKADLMVAHHEQETLREKIQDLLP